MVEQSSTFLTPEEIASISPKNVYNINIGVLGHVDSGKTSLAKTLSRVTSTAALDKNPQSKERGITLDLGFSAFFTRIPEHPRFQQLRQKQNYQYFQFTLVDCPGHASLIKTIIGGASIIDIMFLVIDINKGIQTQTAECLVIGELLMQKMIVILNKIDMIEKYGREAIISKKQESLRKVFQKTKFTENVPMVPIAAMVGADENTAHSENIELLLQTLLDNLELPERNREGPFFYLIDHCFAIKGQGSVVTGTVTQGQLRNGDDVWFPQINETKKVKSMQMFRKNIDLAVQGDRVGILFTQLDNTKIERGIACTPNAVRPINYAIIAIQRVAYCKFEINSKSKFHITSGHQTIMANLKLFKRVIDNEQERQVLQEYLNHSIRSNFRNQASKTYHFDFSKDYEYVEALEEIQTKKPNLQENAVANNKKQGEYIFALLEFEKPLLASINSLLIGSKFDSDITDNKCRLGFYGQVIEILDEIDLKQQKKLKIVRNKSKSGIVEKIVDNYTILIKDLFRKETNINNFIGTQVRLERTGATGKISGAFGKSGKVKAVFDKGVHHIVVSQASQQQEAQEEQKQEELQEVNLVNSEVKMIYKKYLFYHQ